LFAKTKRKEAPKRCRKIYLKNRKNTRTSFPKKNSQERTSHGLEAWD
jgi:hypothetical protein